jgi:hypothetical protein
MPTTGVPEARVKDSVLIVAGSMGVLKVAVIALRVAVLSALGSGSVVTTKGGVTTTGCVNSPIPGPCLMPAAVLTVEKLAEGETETMLDI